MEKLGNWNKALQFYGEYVPIDAAAAYNGMAVIYDTVGMRVCSF